MIIQVSIGQVTGTIIIGSVISEVMLIPEDLLLYIPSLDCMFLAGGSIKCTN
jgi:hypothetical protein